MSHLWKSKYLAFVDECGTPLLDKIESDFPVFVLATIIITRQKYAESIVPALSQLKLKFWPHEGVNIHSRDIRRACGDFACMQVPETRDKMYSEITRFMSQDYTLFITCIRKTQHLAQYGKDATNPYELALRLTFKSVLHFMEGNDVEMLPIIAEARGANEDCKLASAFEKLCSEGAGSQQSKTLDKRRLTLLFRKKRDNIAGLQMADLAAYPYARKILGSTRFDRQIDVLAPRLYQREGISGLKVFP